MVPQTLLVDPDGRGRGKGPILVQCDFATNATIVGSAKKIDFQNCDTNACDEQKIIEDSEVLSQMVSFINSSARCSQEVKFECISAPLKVSQKS